MAVDALARVASSQHGVVSLAQVRMAGISPSELRSLTRKGLLCARPDRVFAFAGSPTSWRQGVMAATLAGGPTAVAGHRTAAALWGLDGYRTSRIEIAVTRWDRRHIEGVTVHESLVLATRDRTTVDGIPVTTPLFTLLDIARHVGDERLGSLVDDAVKRGLVTYEALGVRHGEIACRGRNGVARMRRVLEFRPSGLKVPGSPFEVRVQRMLEDAGIPAPIRQHVISCGMHTYVVDLAWPDARVALECDGWRYHASPSDQTRDSVRRNSIEAHGWRVVNATWEMLTQRPWTITDAVRSHLRAA